MYKISPIYKIYKIVKIKANLFVNYSQNILVNFSQSCYNYECRAVMLYYLLFQGVTL